MELVYQNDTINSMNIKIISEPITRSEALALAKEFYGDMVKGVVDLEKEILAFGGEYHMEKIIRKLIV